MSPTRTGDDERVARAVGHENLAIATGKEVTAMSASPDRHAGWPAAKAAAAPHPAIVMMGPGLQVRGGISAVERILMSAAPADMPMRHIATMVEGSSWRKLSTFLQALVRAALVLRPGDVAHIHFASGASSRRKMLIARLAVRRGARVILHAHGGGYRQYWQRIGAAERAWTLRTLQRAHALVVLGAAWREFFVAIGVPHQRVVLLPNPVELPKHVPARPMAKQMPPRERPGQQRREASCAGGERKQEATDAVVGLVYLGLVAPHKGTFDLLEAIARLPPQIAARVQLVIAGNGALAELRALAARRGVAAQLVVRGWVCAAQRDRLLEQADMFVLPSYGEGLPMSLLEAMAWGLPPICTPVGSIPEYVVDGQNGLLVQVGAIDELSAAITRLVCDPALRLALGRNARAAVEPLEVSIYAKRFATIYRRALADAGLAGEPDAAGR